MRKRSGKAKAEDVNQIAFRIARDSTGQPDVSDAEVRKELMRAIGKLGGKAGGPARAAKLTKEQLSASGLKAARARWAKEKRP
jgi:hypothetical protein